MYSCGLGLNCYVFPNILKPGNITTIRATSLRLAQNSHPSEPHNEIHTRKGREVAPETQGAVTWRQDLNKTGPPHLEVTEAIGP